MIKKIMSLLSLGIIFGFFVGLIIGMNTIMANLYLQYLMFRSIVQSLQQSLNQWIVVILIGSAITIVVISLAFIIVKTIGKSSLKNLIEINIKDKEKAKTLLVCLTICSIFFICSGWAINRYWLPTMFHPLSLLSDVAILMFTIFLGWLLYKNLWKIAINKIAASIIIFLLLLNLGIFLDRKINKPNGPNVILIVVDTLRADRLASNGYFRNISPNIEHFSSRSMHFKNAISAAPWTTPSIASILTSQYPVKLGFRDDPVVLRAKFLTLAEIFKENNYFTKGIISHTLVSERLGLGQGFYDYDEENAGGHGHISSPSITRKAISFLEKNKERKFFLFLHFFDPHFDYILHEEYNYFPEYNGPLYSGQPIRNLLEKAPNMLSDDVKYLEALYDSEISFTDEYIGNLLDKIEDLGLNEKTLIVFTADHGEEFLERGDFWIGHDKKLYQEQIHVPLMIKLPENNQGKIIDEFVGLIDLLPSIAHYASLNIPKKYQYEGKVLDISQKEELNSRIIISETQRNASLLSVIWKDWKLIFNPEMNTIKLFNLKSDPYELENVMSENEAILKTLQEILGDWKTYIETEMPKSKAEKPRFTEEQKEKLRSLGYIK